MCRHHTQVMVGGSSEAQEVADLAALLDALAASLEQRRDFEFSQALLSVVLQQQVRWPAAPPPRPAAPECPTRNKHACGRMWKRAQRHACAHTDTAFWRWLRGRP